MVIGDWWAAHGERHEVHVASEAYLTATVAVDVRADAVVEATVWLQKKN